MNFFQFFSGKSVTFSVSLHIKGKRKAGESADGGNPEPFESDSLIVVRKVWCEGGKDVQPANVVSTKPSGPLFSRGQKIRSLSPARREKISTSPLNHSWEMRFRSAIPATAPRRRNGIIARSARNDWSVIRS